jgi:thioesterase domain-containing protein
MDCSMPATSFRTIFPIRAPRAGPCVFFFPDVGGNVLYAKKIISEIDSDIAFYGIKLDNKLIEHLPHCTLPMLAQSFAAELHASNISKQFHLVGYSFAGLLAYETAYHLTRLGSRVGLVAILDTTVPRHLYSRRFYFRAVSAARAIKHGKYNLVKPSLLGRLVDDPNSILERWLSWQDLSKHPASYRFIIEQLIKARHRYEPASYAGNITLFRASNVRRSIVLPKYLGWEYYAKGKINLVRIRCHHTDLVANDRVTKQVAAQLLRVVNELEDLERATTLSNERDGA